MKYQKQRILNKLIPDENYLGVLDTINVHRNLTVKTVKVKINVSHNHPSDLAVELTGPNDVTVTLDGPGKDNSKGLQKTYSGEVLQKFEGLKSAGNWSLRVIDTSKDDTGILKDWSLILITKNSKRTEIFSLPNTELNSVQVCHIEQKIKNVALHVQLSNALNEKSKLSLESPTGTIIQLPVKNEGNNIEYTHELNILNGESSNGKWKLTLDSGATLTLKGWKLKIETVENVPLVRDDLTKIEGIGPKIKQLLYNGGILSFDRLSKTDPSDIKEILNSAGPRYQMHNPNSWPKQSALAAAGKWEELEKLQNILDGGK